MRCFSLGFFLPLLAGAVVVAQPAQMRPVSRPLSPETLNRYQQLYAGLQPSARNWVDAQARNAVQRRTFDVAQLRSNVLARFPSLRTGQDSNVTAMLVMILTESIEQTNEDKKYYLQKMADINNVSQQLQDQIKQLAQASGSPRSKSASCDSPSCRSLASRLANLNAASACLRQPFHLQAPANPTIGDVQSLVNEMQAMMGTVSDDSQLMQADLQNVDQAYSQAFSLISDVMNEMSDTAM